MKSLILAATIALLGACGDDAPEWSVSLDGDDLDRLVLSAWGTSADDVYVVGGGSGNGLGALVLHYDGQAWSEIATGATQTFWWVWGPDESTTYFVGEEGAVVRRSGDQLETMTTPSDLTLFGVWGSSANDVWAVGGDPLATDATFVILHYDGTAWTDATPAVTANGALFKVWGSSASDVWACGQGGTMLHYDGSAWSEVTSGTTASLFTVHGNAADDFWAVGGPPATVLHYDGTAWSTVDTGIPASVLNGVAAGPDGEVVVVGQGSVKFRYDGTAWTDETDSPLFLDLHGVWIGPEGDTYIVGGNIFAPGTIGVDRLGVVGYYGTKPPPDSL